MENLQTKKHKSNTGPYAIYSDCVRAAKADLHCKTLECFVIIKSYGLYDYLPGRDTALMTTDQVLARYYLLPTGVWSYPSYPTRSKK